MTYQLFHGDCLDVMPQIESGSIDLILCDLPYGTTQCKWDSVLPFDQLWRHYKRMIKPNGAIILTAAQPFTSMLVTSNLEMFRYELVWEKGIATGFMNSQIQPLRAHENILVFYKSQPTFNPQLTHGHKRSTARRGPMNSECYGKILKPTNYDSTSRYPRSVQFFSKDTQTESFHPTQKPVLLMEWLIRSYSNLGDVVLDNCMGSGSTGVAAVHLGRNFLGIEQESKYIDIASRRLAEAEKKASMDLFGGAA